MIIHLCNVLGWVKSASNGIKENTFWLCFIKANCLPVVYNIISNQDINQSAHIDDLMETLQEI
jgi:hypothetical protein